MSAWSWRRLIREGLLTAAAAVGVVCVIAALAAVLLDVRPLIFRSGSMAPEIPTGALALARTTPAAELRPGDVVSVIRADGMRVTHRIVATEPASAHTARLTLQGDANDDPDATPYTVRSAERVFWSQPGLGYALNFAQSTPVVFVGGIIVGGVLMHVFRRRPSSARPVGTRPPGGHAAKAAVPLLVAAVALSPILVPTSPTAAAYTDAGRVASTARTTILQQVVGLNCVTNGTLLTTATVHWSAPASGPVPTGYRITVRNSTGASVIYQTTVGAAARSFQVPPSLLAIATYRVSVSSIYGSSWTATAPTTPAYVRVQVLDVLAIGLVSSCVAGL